LPSTHALTCPLCQGRIYSGQLRDYKCPSCHAELGIAQSYRLCVGLLALASGSIGGAATHQPDSSGAWLLGVILATILFWFIFVTVIPPWLQKGRNQPRFIFLGLWVAAAIGGLVFQFVGFGIVRILLGGSPDE
jgi:hypothetical protein